MFWRGNQNKMEGFEKIESKDLPKLFDEISEFSNFESPKNYKFCFFRIPSTAFKVFPIFPSPSKLLFSFFSNVTYTTRRLNKKALHRNECLSETRVFRGFKETDLRA